MDRCKDYDEKLEELFDTDVKQGDSIEENKESIEALSIKL